MTTYCLQPTASTAHSVEMFVCMTNDKLGTRLEAWFHVKIKLF